MGDMKVALYEIGNYWIYNSMAFITPVSGKV